MNEKTEIRVKKGFTMITPIALMMVGMIFVISSVSFFSRFVKEWVKTEAEIISVWEVYDDMEDRYEYAIEIRYSDAAGKIYETDFGEYYEEKKVGEKMTIQYDKENPETIASIGGEYLPLIFLVVGIGIFIFGLINVIKIIKIPSSDMNLSNRNKVKPFGWRQPYIDPSSMNSSEGAGSIPFTDADARNYYFHFTGKMGQSYIMETTIERTPVYDAVCKHFKLFGNSEYLFTNYIAMTSVTIQIGKTVTHSYGDSRVEYITDAGFKMDNESCWERFNGLGYSVQPGFDHLKPQFELNYYGVPVAHIEQAGANILEGRKQTKMGDMLTTSGLYKIRCLPDYVEGAFYFCFILSRL